MTRRFAFPLRLHVRDALALSAVMAVAASLVALIAWLLAAGPGAVEIAPTRWLMHSVWV